MLDNKIIPETIPFDFDENYEFIRQRFNERGYDLQEGSNTMQLAIAMSYLTSMLNANTAVNINEMLLPLARKRKTVLQNARLLGYEVRHTMSYKYRLTLEFPEGLHQVNRYEKFTSKDRNYYYMGESIPSFEGPRTIELDVVEGNLKQWKDDPSLVSELSISSSSESDPVQDYYVDVPYKNIEEDGLRVFVTYVEPSGASYELVEYPKINNFLIDSDTSGKQGYVRLDNLEFGTPRVYFKLGDVGIDLPENTRVHIDALVSSGTSGELPDTMESSLECDITDILLISNGAWEESSESVKRNAPLFHNSANRLVTKDDYRGFIGRDSRVKSTAVWDGGDEFPYRPGNIWFSSMPRHSLRNFDRNTLGTEYILRDADVESNWYLTTTDTDNIIESMKDARIPTLSIHHRQPVYLEFDYEFQVVRYSRQLTPAEWNKKVFDVVNEYFLSADTTPCAEEYDFEYFQTNLIKRIDAVLTDITGFNTVLSTYVNLTKINILNEELNLCTSPNNPINELDRNIGQVRFHLSTPYEEFTYMDGDNVVVLDEFLPKIISDEVVIDFDNSILLDNRVMEYIIYLGGSEIGKYRVHLDSSDTIEVILLTSLDGIEGTPKEIEMYNLLDQGLKLQIKYNSPNFKVTRNTIPVLNSVKFISR